MKEKLSTLADRLVLRVGDLDHGTRLDVFLARRMTWRSRSSIGALIDAGKVELRGRTPRPSRKVLAGEEIRIALPQPRRDRDLDAQGGGIPLPVLHEDPWLLAVDKPAGIPVHPGGRLLYRTVITELHERYRVYSDPERDIVPKLCHRLDLETSGVLLVGKREGVAAAVGRQLREREAVKEYLAIVHGCPPEEDMLLDAPIGNAERSRVAMKRAVRADGEPARTGIRVLQCFGEFTLIRLRLYTGRRHQLRVHLAHLGTPIVGDKLYGLDEDLFLAYYEDRLDHRARQQLLLPRQALHAARISLRHPHTGVSLTIESSLPEDLRAFLSRLRSPTGSP